MTRHALPLLSAAVMAAAAFQPGRATAADTDARTFAVTVDGKPAGSFKMTLRVADDGTETITTVAAVRVKVLLVSYTYELQSLEVWKGGKLVSVDATANDDGKRKAVKVVAADGGLTVTANGRARKVAADVLTSTGWRHPGAADKARDLVILDTEDGTETAARLTPLPAAKIAVNGSVVETQRFHLTGKKLDTVWWFDPAGRPVRHEMKWDGHKVVLELTARR